MQNLMKCIIMLHFIWVVGVCQRTCVGFFPIYNEFMRFGCILKKLICMITIFQGQNPNPWNVMTVMDYDYKTNMMTCVVPKSDAMVFHPDVFFVPVLPGCLSHMAPTYRWTAFVLAGVDVSRNNMHCKMQIEDQDQSVVKLVIVWRCFLFC